MGPADVSEKRQRAESKGAWPTAAGPDAPSLARCPARAWPQILADLRPLGWAPRAGRLVNPAVAAVLSEATAFLAHKRSAGASGGQHSAASRTPSSTPSSTPQAPLKHRSSTAQAPLKHPSSDAQPSTGTVQNSTDKTINTAERLPFSVSALEKASPAEREFFERLTECLELWKKGSAAKELANWGGWWRNRHREDADKSRRILAEVLSLVRERRITLSPGAAAVDLWPRLP